MKLKIAIMALLAAMLLPGLALAQTRATFEVTKIFADGNDEDTVEVSIDCNTGQILDQDKTLGNGDTVEFVVTSFDDGELDCFIVEGDVTSGYEATYDGDGIDFGCQWEDIADASAFTCEVTNTPAEVSIIVTKEWVIEGDNNNVNLDYEVNVYCDNPFILVEEAPSSNVDRVGYASGTGPADRNFTFLVRPNFPSTNCWVEESVFDSAIEVDNDCGSLTISAGNGDSCTITNTVFFEGIPTLSQYGMAIMALLMLGVGFVGFRRFV